MTVSGIDVAHYQPDHYPTSGLDFVFVKATEGHSYVSPSHAAQVAHGRAAGLLVGHYHFARAGSMSAQADYFLAHARPAPGDVLAFDWEDAAVSAADKDAWLRYVAAKAPEHRLVLYCNRDFWLHRDSTSYCADGLWIADPSAPKSHPRVEHPWFFHQYSEAGGLDHNVGNFADRAALHHWAGSTTPALEDDMALTPQQTYDAVWRTDAVPAPADSPKSNPRWTAESCLRDLQARMRALQAAGAAQSAAIAELAKALASRDGAVDADALVARIEQAIERIDVHLTTGPTGE